MSLPSVLFQALGLCYYPIFGSLGDVALLAFLTVWRRRDTILEVFQNHVPSDVLLKTLVAVAGALLISQLTRLYGKSSGASSWSGPSKPMLFPCQTTHTRLFPKKHSFSYSYLLVGVPVGWEGTAGSMISTGQPQHGRKGWYHIDPADYLERGNAQLGLRGKLDKYLESQVIPSSYLWLLYTH